MKITTYKFNDSTLSVEWSEVMDGKWPYGQNCYEVVFKINENFYKQQ